MLNPRDLFYNNEKPIVEERGPYTFRYISVIHKNDDFSPSIH